MAAGLGLKVGSTTSIAVSTVPSEVSTDEFVTVVRSTALDLEPGRAPALASAASGHALTGFAARVGDPVALVADDGRTFTGDELYATALECLAAEALADTAGDRTVVIAYPTHWQNYTVERLRDAAARHGLADVTFVPEAVASVAWLAGTTRGSDAGSDGLVLVYDLGGSSLEVTLVRTGADSRVVGRSTRSEDIGGGQFDHLVMQHVLGSVDADHLDPFDPGTVAALAVLRDRCAEAKEALSSDTEAVVCVQLPGIETDIRVVRSEIEDVLREPLQQSLDVVREAIRSAGVDPSDVTRVLLTGGGASVPLVAELVSSLLRVPVSADATPAVTSATGAAVLATEVAAAAAMIDSETAAPAESSALAVRGSTAPALRGKHVPAPVSSVAGAGHRAPMSRGRRIAIVAATTAAIAVLAAGGLSVGTMLTSNETPAEATTADTTDVSTAPSAAEVAATTDPATGSVVTTGAPVAGSPSSAASVPGATAPAGSLAPAAAPNTGAAAIPNAAVPDAPAPSVDVPAAPTFQAPAAPVYTPPAVPTQLPTFNNPLPGVVNGAGNVLGGVASGVVGLPGALLGGAN